MGALRSLTAALLACALTAAAARAADPPPADPDGSFLEFLGSVDGLAEVTPNYLAQAAPSRAPVPPPAKPPPPPPAPPPPAAPPGVKNNE